MKLTTLESVSGAEVVGMSPVRSPLAAPVENLAADPGFDAPMAGVALIPAAGDDTKDPFDAIGREASQTEPRVSDRAADPHLQESAERTLHEATAIVRERLAQAGLKWSARGLPNCPLEGQLLRPIVAFGMAPAGLAEPDHPFWLAVLAVQMAHEASLLHDDIIDQAATRRGHPTTVAEHGVASALVQGDHLLSAGYRLAAATGSLTFANLFARSVERTIAGEIEQGRLRGQAMPVRQYLEVAEGKSGELIGCALASWGCLSGRNDIESHHSLGRRIGRLYQMLDDFLDYCPSIETGKPPLQDYTQRRWTWILSEVPAVQFGSPAADVVRLLHMEPDGKGGSTRPMTPMRRCLRGLSLEASGLIRDARVLNEGPTPLLEALIASWLSRAETALEQEEEQQSVVRGRSASCREIILRQLPGRDGAMAHLTANSRSFSFASRFLPAPERERIARVYTFCRVTDDLVDGKSSVVALSSGNASHLMDEWLALSALAYRGEVTGIPIVDQVMRDMSEAAVPFGYVLELIEGMRMDIRGQRYRTMEELRLYTHRVASVVGLWITELAGVRNTFALERAAGLGHAMQLTNILRDVGDDLRLDRLYLPSELLARHGLDDEDVRRMLSGAPIETRYRSLMEEMMELAEVEYRRAFSALPYLPPGTREAFAAAAGVYRGIHDEIRRNGYDNFNRRARTSTPRKAVLAARSLAELRRARAARKRLLTTL